MRTVAPEITLIAHDLRSCYNVGSLLRTCDGLGVNSFIATGTTPYPIIANDSRLPHIAKRATAQIHKTSLGAEKTIQITNGVIDQVVAEFKDNSVPVCALEQHESSTPLTRFTTADKLALIIGNEPSGLPETILKQTDAIIEIPMKGQKESFNVTVATAIALWQLLN